MTPSIAATTAIAPPAAAAQAAPQGRSIVIRTLEGKAAINQHVECVGKGAPARIATQNKTSVYELLEEVGTYAPENFAAWRTDNDLHITFEGGVPGEADAIIEGYYAQGTPPMVGVAEDGLRYALVAESGVAGHELSQLNVSDALASGMQAGYALGVTPMAVLPLRSIPAALPIAGAGTLPLVAAALPLAALGGGGSSSASSKGESVPVVPQPPRLLPAIGPQVKIEIDPIITPDDTISPAEASGRVDITGTVGGDAKVGDTVYVTVNDAVTPALVYADQGVMRFRASVLSSDLLVDAAQQVHADIFVQDDEGNMGYAEATEAYSVGQLDIGIAIDENITADDAIDAYEAAGTVTVSGTVTGADASAGQIVTLAVGNSQFLATVVDDQGVLRFRADVPGDVLVTNPGMSVSASVTAHASGFGSMTAIDIEDYALGGWTLQGDVSHGVTGYKAYSNSASTAQLLIQQGMDVLI